MYVIFTPKVSQAAMKGSGRYGLRGWWLQRFRTRWQGLSAKQIEHEPEKPKQNGQWQESINQSGFYEYHATAVESTWADHMDHTYLHTLALKKPDKFLKEMTPNPKHNGTCEGLDLNHPHHMNLQKEFNDTVVRICKEKGLTDHPALLKTLENDDKISEAAKSDKKDRVELTPELGTVISSLEKDLEQLSNEKNEWDAKIQQLTKERDLSNQQATTLNESNHKLENELAKQTESTEKIEYDFNQLKTLCTEKTNLLKNSQQRCAKLEDDIAQLQMHLSTLLNTQTSWLSPWEDTYITNGKTPEHKATINGNGYTVSFITKTPQEKRYLTKLVFSNEAQPIPFSPSSQKRYYHPSTIFSAFAKKIAMDIYNKLGHGFYYVLKHHLAKYKIPTLSTQFDAQATAMVQPLDPSGIKQHSMDTLNGCLRSENDTSPCAFMDCLAAGYIPTYANIEAQTVPLLGWMELMAASRLLADTNVFGERGENIGYVIERNHEGMPLAVRVIKMNADEAFNFSGENNQLTQCFNPLSVAMKLKEKKDMQFVGQQPTTLPWANLIDTQKHVFCHALKRGLNLFNQPSIIDALLPANSEAFKKAWQTYRDAQSTIYDDVPATALMPCGVPFQPQLHGAMDCPAEKVAQPSMGGAGK